MFRYIQYMPNPIMLHSAPSVSYYVHLSRDIFVDRAKAFRRLSFGGPEIRDGVCLVEEEEEADQEKEEEEEQLLSEDQADGGRRRSYLIEPPHGRLSLAHSGLESGPPGGVIDRNWHWVTTLDLSHNSIKSGGGGGS